MPLRVALLTLESTASAEAVARVLRETRHEVVFLGVSSPLSRGRARRIIGRCGPRIIPWLLAEFVAPRLMRARGTGPLAAAARARGVTPTPIADINGAFAQAAIEAARPDVIAICHFDQILAPEVLALAPRGGVNLHPSLLPLHRGPMPCFWAAAEGGGDFGVSVHRLVPRIDAGAVIAQRRVPVPAGATVSAAARLLHQAGAEMLLQALEDIATGRDRGRDSPPMPYRSFPDGAAIAAARRKGVRLAGLADWRAGRALGGVAV